MFLRTDEYGEQLFLKDEEVFADGEVFDLPASEVADVLLSEIPLGFQVQLCDHVLGTLDELYGRSPHIVFENSSGHGLIAHFSTPFISPNDDCSGEALREFFLSSLKSGERSLDTIRAAGRLIAIDHHISNDIAFLNVTLALFDQTLLDAEAFVSEIDDRILTAHTPPSLFVCHASEDRLFVDRLVTELDRRAMFAWYDKREIIVGDSIVEKINEALRAADFLITVMSPRSVSKPWVVREMSSALMRQLGKADIKILPVLMEECDIPSLLADLKYADFTESFDRGMTDLIAAIRAHAGA
jgi:hypothetical protein